MQIKPGDRVKHAVFGQGVVISLADDYARIFFADGERQVPLQALQPLLGRNETVVTYVQGGQDRAVKAWLCWQAHELPLMDSASSLTSAKIDLLPHQVVLTYHVATSMPRRFLIADEVGLGKTIETALILRELASRGELNRALMVVPAGLVNNWHRELNDVFNLNFEIFGREGDVSDRRTNAFAKHNLLIASIDTLKRPERIKKLLDAPLWDVVVFDEAHHLTAHKQGNKIRKTQNYKLAEILRDHCRDLILLSATPHQGDHFRFWKLIQLLDPILFEDEIDMLEQRHRLNPVVIRRTKADACRSDGSNLFARRWVHTEAFVMSDEERLFYQALNDYLRDGFALAKKVGGKGRALGFIMTIFQKIAASSFAAVRRTLRRRLLALTIHEGLMHDLNLDIEARDQAFSEARDIIRTDFGLGYERIHDLEVDHILNDAKRRLLKKLDEEELELASGSYCDEADLVAAEDMAMNVIAIALPEERTRIKALLQLFPVSQETKVDKLLGALGVLWQQNTSERIVIFATYLGTVEMLGEKIELAYPGQGVVVLKGGDHGSKVAAEKRFKQANGPRVMICTAAGREGINLQHARILFNFDLPWNPMDVEQRIGRIHRYGQNDTAQVYNLVLGDTIEGKIYLLLDDKLKEIALTLGKVDEQGNVAEDLRSQILGQLSERIKYQELYAQALQDPELIRTRLELDAAMKNASQARAVVFELFQDLDRFSLDDYTPLSKIQESLNVLISFIDKACGFDGFKFNKIDDVHYDLRDEKNNLQGQFTTDRDEANNSEQLQLIGLDHPFVENLLIRYRQLPAEEIGIAVKSSGNNGILSIWEIETHNDKGHDVHSILKFAVDKDGNRLPIMEKQTEDIFQQLTVNSSGNHVEMLPKLETIMERELKYRGIIKDEQPYSAGLIGWIEVV
ncbi:MAG: DEAD/DEAH box helicase [Methylococcaceae bacterium]|nr:MAG: DEAD/DEAH box helicase [Methylococcaceae bacterium]